MRLLRPAFSVLFCAGLGVSPVLAWGPDGHRVIGEIASRHLTVEAAAEVERLLEPGRWGALADVGNWADEYARRDPSYEWANKLHYIDVDPVALTIDLERDCPRGECVIGAIRDMTARLGDASLPTAERAVLFRFLVHFIEDIHQPLHVVHPDMTGGNETTVTFFGEETNLHSVWDSKLIERRLTDFERRFSWPWQRRKPWQRWADALDATIEPEDDRAWTAATDPIDWAAEMIEPSRRLAFDVRPGDVLAEPYYEATIGLIEENIRRAAIRLAATLNRILAPAHQPSHK